MLPGFLLEQACYAATSLIAMFAVAPAAATALLIFGSCVLCSLSEIPESHQAGTDTGGNLSNETLPGRVTFMSRTRSVPASSSDLEAAAVGISDRNGSLDDSSLEHRPLLPHESASDAV